MKHPFQDTSLSFEARVKDLIGRMSLKEKISQMSYRATAIKKFGIPPYDWWNEALHGVARAGIATVFPQATALGATFHPELIFQMAQIISEEGRAKYHDAIRKKNHGRYYGLTFWSPNINIFRDPRWGRGHETYGEDPFLTGQLGAAFIRGMQGDDPKYLKVIATPKHYAVHSGPEKDRHRFNAVVTEKELRETYLPHFKHCIQEAKAESIMGAYNRTNGEPCCGSKTLLQKILRDEWGFQGYVVSDCGAIDDFHRHHHVTKTPEESAALAVNMGCDLNCGFTYGHLMKAVKKKLITEEAITRAVTRLFMARFKLGMFDPPEMVKYQTIPFSKNDCLEHRQFALQVAKESLVLLKNTDKLLPLLPSGKKIAVIGPNADDPDVLLGNYNGTPSKSFTPYQGIKNWVAIHPEQQIQLSYAKGCDIIEIDEIAFPEAIQTATNADIVIACMGISPKLEGEEGFRGWGDRTEIGLPLVQQKLLESLNKTGKPIILVLLNGGPLSIQWAQENIPAILEAWYPGEEGGNAIAEVLFGSYCPAGRMPMTTVYQLADLPPFEDYHTKGRTYRFLEKAPLYPFGYGLSYTKFQYSNLQTDKTEYSVGDSVEISINLQNIGEITGDEVIQVYIKDLEASVSVANFELRAVQRTSLEPGETKTVSFSLKSQAFELVLENGDFKLEPGEFEVFIGGSQPDERSQELTGAGVLYSIICFN